jgi:hypothetical protein
MTAEIRLTAELEKLITGWQALATEAQQRADQRRRGNLSLAYLYGCAGQLERNAAAIREMIAKRRPG